MKQKLVRDKIPEIIKESNETAKTHIASETEYWPELKNKLIEEVNEFLKDNTLEELADIQEVLYAIYDYKKTSKKEIESIRLEKENKRGGFKNKIILEESQNNQELKLGEYKHYKGNQYEVIGLARHSETLEELVIYKALYNSEEFGENALWARPKSIFFETVKIDNREIPRFKFIK